ncbi:MAG TPA: DNA polymerase III subunit delta [Patescibacteria group bacterium]|nr:DNA polymerase III subunit delta [Patescibacteria group bacterium]
MKLTFRDIEPFLANPPKTCRAVLLYGPDEGRVRERAKALIRQAGVADKDPFALVDITPPHLNENPAALLDEAKSISMLGGAKAVRLRLLDNADKLTSIIKDTLKQLGERDNRIVIEAGELGPRSSLRLLFEQQPNAAAVPCYVDDERDLSRMMGDILRQAGFRISGEAMSLLAANVVGDRMVARGEAEKLMIYMGGQRDIGVEDVTACVGAAAQLPLDDLTKFMGSGQFGDADRVLQLALAEGESPVAILRHMQNYFGKLQVTKARIAKGESLDLALKMLKPPLFFKLKDSFVAQMNGWSAAQLEQAISLLMACEAKCKMSGAEPETLVSRAVLSLSQIGGRALSQRRRA